MRKMSFIVILLVGELIGFQNHPTDSVINRILSTPLRYPIRFAYVADSRNSFDPNDPSADSIFSLIKETINEISPLFVVHGGDFIQRGYTWEYDHFLNVIDSFETNLLTVRGNHELYADEGPYLYDSLFGETDYYFDYGGYRFIFLADCQQDSLIDPYYGTHRIDYFISEEQIDWLDSLLTEADSLGYWAFVFAHVPPYLPGHDTTYCLGYYYYFPRPNYSLSHTQEFTDLLRDHNVVAGIFGHQHFYDRWTYQGVLYLISGGGGSPLIYPLQPPPYGAYVHHFLLLELDSTYDITVKLYKAGSFLPDPQYTFTYSTGVEEETRSSGPEISGTPTLILKQGQPIPLTSVHGTEPAYLYDVSGKMIGETKMGSADLETDGLAPGIYFLLYHLTGKTKVLRIIILPG